MSNFNRFMKSSAAAYRRSEREQQRKAREASRQFKIQQKQDAIADASQAVEQYNDYINVLKSVHKQATENIDWNLLLQEQPPAEPTRSNKNEQDALRKQNNYKPSFLDKILGSEKNKRKKLQANTSAAIQKDEAHFSEQIKKHGQDTNDYHYTLSTAKGVLEKQTQAYKDAIEFFEPFSDIGELGTKVQLEFHPEHITATLKVNNREVLPDYILSQTSTGKLSKKNMPATKFNDLYQDYVSSCVLRVAREALAYLPVNYVVVNAAGNLFDSKTGHEGEQTILSVVITPEKLNSLNLDTIDPSDSMKNFHHHMQFSKSNGFSAVTAIDGTSLIL